MIVDSNTIVDRQMIMIMKIIITRTMKTKMKTKKDNDYLWRPRQERERERERKVMKDRNGCQYIDTDRLAQLHPAERAASNWTAA